MSNEWESNSIDKSIMPLIEQRISLDRLTYSFQENSDNFWKTFASEQKKYQELVETFNGLAISKKEFDAWLKIEIKEFLMNNTGSVFSNEIFALPSRLNLNDLTQWYIILGVSFKEDKVYIDPQSDLETILVYDGNAQSLGGEFGEHAMVIEQIAHAMQLVETDLNDRNISINYFTGLTIVESTSSNAFYSTNLNFTVGSDLLFTTAKLKELEAKPHYIPLIVYHELFHNIDNSLGRTGEENDLYLSDGEVFTTFYKNYSQSNQIKFLNEGVSMMTPKDDSLGHAEENAHECFASGMHMIYQLFKNKGSLQDLIASRVNNYTINSEDATMTVDQVKEYLGEFSEAVINQIDNKLLSCSKYQELLLMKLNEIVCDVKEKLI